MYEILKQLNETTSLAFDGKSVCILKEIGVEDVPLYKQLLLIKNDNIAGITEIITMNGRFYAVREYVQGITLEEYIEKNQPISDETVISIIGNVCSGLSDIHMLGIVHRDITPSNIIIDSRGNAKIIDFGISRLRKENVSRDTQILGTQGYAAPEQYGFSQTTQRSDIYALGVMINYMKTGKLPNEALASGKLGEIVRKAIQIDEKNRYQNVEELKEALGNTKPSRGFIHKVPGFRSGILWHEVLGAGFYFLMFALITSFVTDYTGIRKLISDFATLIFCIFAPAMLLTECGDWMRKFNITQSKNKRDRMIIKILFASVSFVIGSVFILTLK